jgi:predicted molibdopterin-dependent oxidoreductase YjgC
MRVQPRGRLPLGPDQGIERGPAITVTVDGQPRTAYAGETVAAALIADDGIVTRRTASGAGRGVYCGMGVCFDCLVVIDGIPNTRACMTLVADGMRIDRQDGPGLAR